MDAHTLQVNGRQIRGDKIAIATGSEPVVPPLPGRELAIRTGAHAGLLSRQLSIHPSHGERQIKIFGKDYHEVCEPA